VKDNPKTAGNKNHARFAALMRAAKGGLTTVAGALAAGATAGDLAYDAEHGFIALEAPAAKTAAA
jgi:hypothetical protein